MNHTSSHSARGFTLTEVLIAMVIGIIGLTMASRIMQQSEVQKRSTSAGGDAQISGALSLFHLERDVSMAGNGFGMVIATSMGCTVTAYDTDRATPAFNFRLAPIVITDGAAGAPDQIAVLYGNPDNIATDQAFDLSTATSKRLSGTASRAGFVAGDLALVINGSSCGLVEITAHDNADLRTINHNAGSYTRYYPYKKTSTVTDADYEYDSGTAPSSAPTARFNNPGAGYTLGTGTLYNLGKRSLPRRNIWSIQNNRDLTVADDLHDGDPTPIGEGIVDLQAEYGLDTTGTRDYLVDTWQATAPADWTRVIAIRVALLARSQQYEKEQITVNAPTWRGGTFTMRNVDGTTGSTADLTNDWRHYRYRVYESVIPLRNMIWGTSP